MNAYLELLVGILLAVVGIAMLVVPQLSIFREGVKTVILGVIPIVVLLAAAVFLMIGVSDVREKGEEELESETEKNRG
ncbi:MAG: hypothetical protein OCU20_00190 [Methanophagales archaeon]|nr:hypothetical protein [Methanophagales archaeon]MCW3138680.1 hypothetical protein [Methanophagales archaeon]MCW3139708.1 hypothetical protein [Methanophagales archaeon]MCW7069175.1 hypothetical protein [Methanophagales archaeon]MCW7072316.1 hypothetical protein [Methanophagales archaeon]